MSKLCDAAVLTAARCQDPLETVQQKMSAVRTWVIPMRSLRYLTNMFFASPWSAFHVRPGHDISASHMLYALHGQEAKHLEGPQHAGNKVIHARGPPILHLPF